MPIARRPALVFFAILELAVLLAAFAKPAYGYVDPGSGLLAVQIGGSMLAGALFVVRSKLRRLFGLAPAAEKARAEENAPTETGE